MRNDIMVHNQEKAEKMLSFYELASEYNPDMDIVPIEEVLTRIKQSINRKKIIESNQLRTYSNYK